MSDEAEDDANATQRTTGAAWRGEGTPQQYEERRGDIVHPRRVAERQSDAKHMCIGLGEQQRKARR